MKDNREILDLIKEKLNSVHKSENVQGRKNWTQAFMDELKKLGKENKYKVYTSSASENLPGQGEWLFDLCWSIENGEGDEWMKNYRGLKLICESEWNTSKDEILYDFQKLAVARADIKIMIIQLNIGGPSFKQIKEFCEETIHDSLRDKNEIYVLVGSSNIEDEIKFEELWKSK